jgi:hypothetical protein
MFHMGPSQLKADPRMMKPSRLRGQEKDQRTAAALGGDFCIQAIQGSPRNWYGFSPSILQDQCPLWVISARTDKFAPEVNACGVLGCLSFASRKICGTERQRCKKHSVGSHWRDPRPHDLRRENYYFAHLRSDDDFGKSRLIK